MMYILSQRHEGNYKMFVSLQHKADFLIYP